MICENCGAKIGDDEDYCPNCGMELFIPKSKRKPVSKKPLKERYLDGEYQDQEDYEDIYESYVGYDEPETPKRRDHHKKPQKQDYESYEYDDYEPSPSKKSGGMGATLIILIAALIIGFMIGIMVFSGTSQVVPSLKIG